MASSTLGKTFDDLTKSNPCEGCPAPCCRMQILPCLPPQTLMNLDHMRFSLLFPNTEITISITGEFSLVKWATCQLFDTDSCLCGVHNTPKKPLTCVHFNPHGCWYKRNFVTEDAPDICRLDLKRFERWVQEIEFENDRVISAPTFQETQEMIRAIRIQPTFKVNPELIKDKPVGC
ncbi:hypothetical protein [Candidatus Odyssella acanthamoebae]|uniref:Uncharacterized protein n=1 Tax=Candidatus Odyssella acanthamoebae TaxID=91604 RepID=A0A077ATB5_9PROT|nr:hypothetical protein [Candidatus Paracaedibacter acanthamoebae]AIK95631.1 hypothetical protein ID47_01010 [Candidatus Paracaedibacter acanthamoebae]